MMDLQKKACHPCFEEEKNMLRYISHREESSFRPAVAVIVFLTAITLALCCPVYAQTKKQAPAAKQTTFKSYDEAVMALVDAVKASDQKKLLAILGPGSESVVSSGDPVADREAGSSSLNAMTRQAGLRHEQQNGSCMSAKTTGLLPSRLCSKGAPIVSIPKQANRKCWHAGSAEMS